MKNTLEKNERKNKLAFTPSKTSGIRIPLGGIHKSNSVHQMGKKALELRLKDSIVDSKLIRQRIGSIFICLQMIRVYRP